MFEFLVTAILIGVLFGLRNLLKKTGALEHETRVLGRRLESVSQHLTSIASALRTKTIGESHRGRPHTVSLEVIADLEGRLAEVFVRLNQLSAPLTPKEPAEEVRKQPPELEVLPQGTSDLAAVADTQSTELPRPEPKPESVASQADSFPPLPQRVVETVPPISPPPLSPPLPRPQP
jgi:hypothetical protein